MTRAEAQSHLSSVSNMMKVSVFSKAVGTYSFIQRERELKCAHEYTFSLFLC